MIEVDVDILKATGIQQGGRCPHVSKPTNLMTLEELRVALGGAILREGEIPACMKPPETGPKKPATKVCSTCGKELPLSEFPTKKMHGIITIIGQCRPCWQEYHIRYRSKYKHKKKEELIKDKLR
ncbi:MAG: hypothetical protein MJY60_04140 [Bacteroidales bacterium]|nr:hypothetical protein [Bacteroidales bacterium]